MFIIRLFFFIILFSILYAVIRILILVMKAKRHIDKTPQARNSTQEKDISKEGKVLDEKWLDDD